MIMVAPKALTTSSAANTPKVKAYPSLIAIYRGVKAKASPLGKGDWRHARQRGDR